MFVVIEREIEYGFGGENEFPYVASGDAYGPFSTYREANAYAKKKFRWGYWIRQLRAP